MNRNPYTFLEECDTCGQQPVLRDTGMCAVCSYGTADALWDWLGEHWEGKELYKAQQYLKNMQKELTLAGMDFGEEIAPRIHRLLSFRVRRRQLPKGRRDG